MSKNNCKHENINISFSKNDKMTTVSDFLLINGPLSINCICEDCKKKKYVDFAVGGVFFLDVIGV